MKQLLFVGMFCTLGCKHIVFDRHSYARLIAEMEASLANGDVSYFEGVDVWGRRWEIENFASYDTDAITDVRWYKSCGENISDENDDIKVFVHRRFDGEKLVSWGYSYSYGNHGCVSTGGVEFD